MSRKNQEKTNLSKGLPSIPDKIYFTIGEVATLCELKPHVLRYWEQEFAQLNPTKRRGNRRYYQRKEVLLIRRIKELLYDRGFTIDGARQQLDDKLEEKLDKQSLNIIVLNAINELEQVLLELTT